MTGKFPITCLADRSVRLEHLKRAVLKLMIMNSHLYRFLYSNTFDVPEYEKENIAYNSQLLRNQFKEYFEVNFYNPDFKYHQRELDEQILCNKRIRQNVRESREMYADISNPWYSRKTFKPKEVISDAVKLNLHESLPMTHLCDHLLTVYHYMHDPQIAEVMNDLVADENKALARSDITVTLPERWTQRNEGDSNSIRIQQASHPLRFTYESNQVKPPVKPTLVPQPPRPIVEAKLVKPAVKPILEPDTTQPPRPIVEATLVKPAVKPTMISSTDLVGQILLQGFEQSTSESSSNTRNTIPVVIPAQSFKRSKVVNLMKDTMHDTKRITVQISTTSTTNSRAAPCSVSWNMSKLLTPRATGAEKRPCDLQVEQAQVEMEAKRQRLSQWLGSLKVDKKPSAGIKRKAPEVKDESLKDHASKRRKLSEAKTKPAKLEPIRITIKKSRLLEW